MEILRDIIAAIVSCSDPITEGFVALTLGFAAVPTGIGFLVGAALMLVYQSVVPVSFQVEGLAVVARLSKGNWKTMCYAVMLSGIVGAILGFAGVFEGIVAFIGTGIQGGLLVGAGLILAIVSIEIFKENWKIGTISIAAAYGVFLIWGDLVWVLLASVLLSIIASRWIRAEPIRPNPEIEKVRLLPRSVRDLKYFTNRNVIIAALGILSLRIGTSIAYGGVDEMLSGIAMNADHVNITSGLACLFSGMFGGANLEPIIAGHVAAPHPIYAGALMLAVMGVLCLTGVLPRVTRWIPTQAVCGFLMTISLLIVIPENAPFMLEEPVAGAVTAGITAATINPFAGMVVGIIVRAIMMVAGA